MWGVAAVIVAVIALAMWHTNGGDSSAWLARLKASANGAAGSATGASGAVAQVSRQASDATAVQDGASAPEAQAAADNPASATPMPAPLGTDAAPASASAVTAVDGRAQGRLAAPKAALQAAARAVARRRLRRSGRPRQRRLTAGEAIVALRVTQDSWFSVRDKDGKEVFSGLVHAGDTKEVTGDGAFQGHDRQQGGSRVVDARRPAGRSVEIFGSQG